VKEWEKIFQAVGALKHVGVVIFISDKTEFTSKLIIRNKKNHFIFKKGTIPKDEITIVNIYEPNVGTTNSIKENPLRGLSGLSL
jgi:hypothetical protein